MRTGNPIDLIADGTYDRGRTTPLGRQGINGWIWGLIALDSLRYPIPDGAFYTRDDIILEILRQQLPDGGFALSGGAPTRTLRQWHCRHSLRIATARKRIPIR